MKRAINAFTVLCILAAAVADPCPAGAAERRNKLRVLLLSGKNNHNWKATTPALVKILEGSGRFTVTVTNDPAADLTVATLAKCDVIVSNWAGFPQMKARQWGPTAEKAFIDFIKGGKGFVLFHAASASFHTWPEFQQIGGATWGKGTGHGRQHSFRVDIADGEHPITKGMKAFQTTDELWHRMQAHPDRHVLCTAFSAKDKGGSGLNEPVAITTKLGEGRGFNLVLGHGVTHMQNPAWTALMCRGAEWAATGKVTLALPAKWPDATGPPPPGAVSAAQIDVMLKKTATFAFGADRADLVAVGKLVSASEGSAALRGKLADAMAAMLAAKATPDCKAFLCEQLSLIGSARHVGALSALLNDATLALHARAALARIPGDEPLAAMRKAMASAKGPALAGLITTLGDKRDAASLDVIASHLASPDATVAMASVDALGRIGGPAAAKALLAAKLPGQLKATLADALLRLAEELLKAGDTARAEGIFKKLSAPGQPKHVRTAAFPGLVACQKGRAVAMLTKALTGKDRALQSAAIRCARTTGGPELTKVLAAELPKLSPAVQVQLIDALGDRGDKAALPAITAASSDKMPPAVRLAAIAAIGRIGGGDAIGILAGCAAGGDAAQQRVARAALARLKGKDVDKMMIALTATLATADSPGLQKEMIIALRSRGVRAATPALLNLFVEKQVVRLGVATLTEAAMALRELADARHCPTMVTALVKATSPTVRREIENALIATCRRTNAGKETVAAATKAMASANAATKASLLRVLANLGGAKSLAAVRSALKDDDAAVRTAAIRALGEWPDGSALDDLLAVARSAKETVPKVLALRGFARLAPQAEGRKGDEMVRLFTEALALAPRADEKQTLLSALGLVHSAQAMQLALAMMDDPAVADEAAIATVQIAEGIWRYSPEAAKPVVRKLLKTAKSHDVKGRASAILLAMTRPVNLAIGATATSPDGLEKDGASGGDQAAVDGNAATYWDEADDQKLYVLRVTLKAATQVSAVSILGFQHHAYSPKDFEVLCDGKVVKTVRNAQYTAARLIVAFTPLKCTTVELKITGCYGASPAIRELEIYNADPSPVSER